MKLFTVLTTLAALAVAAPTPEPEPETGDLDTRQVYDGCNTASPGQYHCYVNISNRNDPWEYIGLCGVDYRTYVSAWSLYISVAAALSLPHRARWLGTLTD